MTQSRKRAMLSLAIWGGVAVTFLALFFSGGGPGTFGQDRMRIVVSAAVFAGGYAGYALMLTLTRTRPENGATLRDERDDWIASRVNSVTLVATLLFVFAACIALWLLYGDSGLVPVGWMWFLAYFSGFLAYAIHAAITLLYDGGVIGHAEG